MRRLLKTGCLLESPAAVCAILDPRSALTRFAF